MNPPVYFKPSVSQVHAGCSGTGVFEPLQSSRAGAVPLNLSHSAHETEVEAPVDGLSSDSTEGEEAEEWLKQDHDSDENDEVGPLAGGAASDCGRCACDNDSDHESVDGEVRRDLIEELVIEHCLQAHHAFKSGALVVGQRKLEMLDKDEEDKVVEFCHHCKGEHKVKDYLTELVACMNIKSRTSARNSSRAKAANYRVDQVDGYDSEEEAENAQKKKKRRKQNGSRSVKVLTQSDKRGSNPDQLCGIKMKNGKYCPQRKPCSRHSKKVSDLYTEEKLECFPTSFPAVHAAVPVYFVPDVAEKPPEFTPIANNNSPGIKLLIRTDGIKKTSAKSESYHPSCS